MASQVNIKEKVCLVIIDGWGVREESHGNAILNAETPVMDKLMQSSILLEASERNVGLPEGQCGNSEVGHLNLGAGRIVNQYIVQINDAIQTGSILQNPALTKACARAKTTSKGRIHLFGLCSDGGVHAHIDHILGIADACKGLGVAEIYLHFIADGRDTSPTSGAGFVKQALKHLKDKHSGKLATVMGRYYAMDRDNHWDRLQIAFEAYCSGKGTLATDDSIVGQIEASYAQGQKHTDEFLTPFVFGGDDYRIKDNDTLIFLNFRSDRARMLVQCFGIKPPFECNLPKNLEVFCMVKYNPEFKFDVLFGSTIPENALAQWLSLKGIPQLHVAETEKYAHVTFFFNGGIEKQYELEDRILVPSPKVPTYDLQPAMSCEGIGDAVVGGIASGKYPFIMLNIAAPDMVGHAGIYQPCVEACTATDKAIGKILAACEKHGYVMMVTADHGNAEKMYDENNKPFTAHTLYPVPLTINKGFKLKYPTQRKPALCDVAVTVLDLMGVPKPPEMTGLSLLDRS